MPLWFKGQSFRHLSLSLSALKGILVQEECEKHA